MRAGTLRERITIQKSTPVQDSYGEPIDSWANIATNSTVWANVGSRASGERFISGGEQVQATVSHTVRIRYRDDVTVKMRLEWRGNRVLEIENVIDPDGRKADLILMCTEVQIDLPEEEPDPDPDPEPGEWWEAAGITPVAVYQAIGAESLEASYVNLANPGTNDAEPGVAPTFNSADGWTFNGSTQYLQTGLIPAQGWAIMVRFSDGSGTGYLVGSTASGAGFTIRPVFNTERIYAYAGTMTASGAKTAGTLAMTEDDGFADGVADTANTGSIGTFSGTGIEIYLGARNSAGSPQLHWAGKIQAVVIFDESPDTEGIAALHDAMMEL